MVVTGRSWHAPFAALSRSLQNNEIGEALGELGGFRRFTMELSSFSSHPKRRYGWLGFALENKAERFNTISALLGAIASWSMFLRRFIMAQMVQPRPFFQDSTTYPFIF
jgi:hypothetical protein